MPPARSRKRDSATGTSKTIPTEQIVDLFGFIGLHELGKALDGVLAAEGARGRKSSYPATLLLAVLASARAAGSLAQALKELRDNQTLWQRCCDAYTRRSPEALIPPAPPMRDQMRYFRDKVIADPQVLERLQQRFQVIAVGQARRLGNLLTGVVPDGADPDERHTIYGDGTIIGMFSDVRVIEHHLTGEKILIGSRAESRRTARIQSFVSDTSEDDKHERGLNMVALHTWTRAGRVVLGTGTAMKAELWAALDLVDSIHAIAGDGVHTLIYDRAITGWPVDYLMARKRIQVLGKSVAAGSSNAFQSEISDASLRSQVERTAIEYDVRPGSATPHILRRDVLADMVRYNEHFPVGTSVYPTQKRNFDFARSTWIELPDAVHETTTGPCRHRLVVDDGGLFLVDDHPEEGYPVKTRFLSCERSTPYERTDGRWGTRNEYTIPCVDGDFSYVRHWDPDGVRYTQDSTETDRAPQDRVGWFLRPLSRADDIADWYNGTGPRDMQTTRRFSASFSRRNDAESYNEWYQRGLTHHGRAASLHKRSQELDFLLAALLNNSITWQNRKN